MKEDVVKNEIKRCVMGITIFDKYAEAMIADCDNPKYRQNLVNKDGTVRFCYDYEKEGRTAYTKLYSNIISALGQWKNAVYMERVLVAIPSDTSLIKRKFLQYEAEKNGFCADLRTYSEVIPFAYEDHWPSVEAEWKVMQILKCSDGYEIAVFEGEIDELIEVWGITKGEILSIQLERVLAEWSLNYKDIQMVCIDNALSKQEKDVVGTLLKNINKFEMIQPKILEGSTLLAQKMYPNILKELNVFPKTILVQNKTGNFIDIIPNNITIPVEKEVEIALENFDISRFSLYEKNTDKEYPTIVGVYDLTKLFDGKSIENAIHMKIRIETRGNVDIIVSHHNESHYLTYWKMDQIEEKYSFPDCARKIFRELLPSLDNLDRSIKYAQMNQEESLVKGLECIREQILNVFVQVDIRPIMALNQPFSVKYHDAIIHEENPAMGDNLIVEELQRGYMYKNTVLRYSKVKVVN